MLNKVNGIRKSRGLPALQWQQSMDSAAARHSYDMSGKRQMSHSGACWQTQRGWAGTAAAARGAPQRAINQSDWQCAGAAAGVRPQHVTSHWQFEATHVQGTKLSRLLPSFASACPARLRTHALPLHAGSDGSQFYDRLRIAGGGSFKCSAENVAMTGSGTSPSTVVDMWMGSQGHRDNMMKKEFTHMGMARAYNGGMVYWTMVLGGCGK